MTTVAWVLLAIVAALGWLSFWCAEDKIADLASENRDLRRTLARRSRHPAGRGRGKVVGEPLFADEVGFDRIAAAIRALPEPSEPTLVLDEDAETVEWRSW